MKTLTKLFRIILAIFLVPICIGSVTTLGQVLLKTGSAETIWITTLAGAVLAFLVCFFFPEPKWIYVLGHELTHALWSWGFGGKLKKIKVSSEGGHVLITKANFLTSLAPYFFPLYVISIVIVFVIGNHFLHWDKYVLWFYFFIGMTYTFHIIQTYRILKIKQPDIVQEGYIFSAVIIFLGNMCILLIGIPLLTTKVTVNSAFHLWFTNSEKIYHYLAKLF